MTASTARGQLAASPGRREVATFGWLLRHELRLALRGIGRRRWLARAAPLLLLAAVPVIGGIAVAVVLAVADHGHRPTALSVPLGWFGVAVIALLVVMLSTAAIGVLRTFHDRGDLDLLLAAPIPPARVLAAKAAGVAVAVAAPFALLIAPFGLARAMLGHPRWIGTVAMIGVDAVVATAIAILVVGALIARLGPRPARVVVQLGAAAVGGMAFLASQAGSLAPALARRLAAAAARPWPAPLDWPARAARGEVLPLAAMIALAAAAAWVATRSGARALAAAGDAGGGRAIARTTVVRFRAGLTRVVVAKELRLIARDPELITQVAMRLVYLIPAAALLVRGGDDPGPAVAAAVTAFAGLLAASLAWIVVAAEDAPDLIAAAPRAAAVVARAKLIAATIIPLVAVAIAALAVIPVGIGAAAATLGGGTAAAISAALLQAWFGRPAPRSAFRRRQRGSFVVGVGEIVLAGAWAGAANLAARGSPWAFAPMLLAGMIIAGALEARSSPTAI